MKVSDASGQPRNAICYLVPFYSRTDDQHFAHLPSLLSELAKHCDLYVIVERGGEAPDIANARVVLVQQSDPNKRIRRYWELLRLIRRVRRLGCRRFFVRISRGAALVLLAARPFLHLEIYYWNSGQGREAWPRTGTWVSRFRLRWADRVLGLIIRQADRFVTGPERMIDYYVRSYGVKHENCRLLYNDVDTSTFKPLTETDRVTRRRELGLPIQARILFIGRVSRYKGGEFILPIARALRSTMATHDAQIAVAGSMHLAELEVQMAADPTVLLLGSRPNGEIPTLMQAADLLILPSLSEGFPRVLIEAMACGLPVVAFDVGGVRDILGPAQQEHVVRRGDVEGMAGSVRAILMDQSLAEHLREENLREVERFSTERVAKMFVQLVALI